MRLIDADELRKRIEVESFIVDMSEDVNGRWQRKNEIVRILQIIENMPEQGLAKEE